MEAVSCAIMRIRAFSAKAESMSEKEILDELNGIADDVAALEQDEAAGQIRQAVGSMKARMREWQN
jgi:hypothetical protein